MAKKLTYFYLIPMGIVLFMDSLFSLLKTTYFELYLVNEVPSYKRDHPLLLLAVLLIMGAVSRQINRYLSYHKSAGKKLAFISCLWSGMVSSFFVLLFRCGVVCDSAFLSEYATEFMEGNYEALAGGSYLGYYPFQLGMVAFLELVYRLFGAENYLAFQFINVTAILLIIHYLHKITWELFEDERVRIWEEIISMGMLPLFLYATFVYGDVVGIACGTGAVYYGIRYIRSDRWNYLLPAGILLMLGTIVKSNTTIFLLAIVIALFLKILENRKWSMILWIIGIVVLSQVGVWTINSVYIQRAGIDKLGEGAPKAAWIAMGLQEAKEIDNGCGWYNGYNMNVYADNGFDTEAAAKESMESIRESLKRFVHNPQHAVYYFYKKFVSQWNDPTFQSMIVNEWYSRYSVRSELADFFIYGTGRKLLSHLMNAYHLIVLLCSTAGCIYVIKNWRLERAYLLLNVFGGFLFHMIWEAKGRYILGYFTLLLPIAAAGLVYIFQAACDLSEQRGKWKRKDAWID
ncbi:glycosyltransferase family 39 protein [Parablautia muri]|uniref:Glycosyltransferase RgtA/B/C/D-like domain-containing protein n=1 Tax=Parablautia muri TaxID=2320879 RepID=A0A9X5GQL3_9FIRM|nr:glycosyltransferase family 39 protein [Parablautia muri]NBJ91329.1 hypothetical protein [Parablautia muri]